MSARLTAYSRACFKRKILWVGNAAAQLMTAEGRGGVGVGGGGGLGAPSRQGVRGIA